MPAAVATREIAAALSALQPGILLFLRNIGRLRTGGPGAEGFGGGAFGHGAAGGVPAGHGVQERAAGGVARWQRPVEGHPGQRVEVAFRLGAGRSRRWRSSPLTVFFPTEKETFLGFLIQGPYRTTPARDNIPGDDPSNQALVRQTAALLADVLPELRDEGLLTADALQALPLDEARFPAGSMFRPLFDAVG